MSVLKRTYGELGDPGDIVTRRIRIAPSILSADFARLGEQVREAETAGADFIHVDVMDGHFVPNITVGPLVVRAVRGVTDLPISVHLMIEEPDRYLADFAVAGASVLTVHWEACPHLHRTIQCVKAMDVLAGVALNPATPAGLLVEVLSYLDLVLVMTVNPGFGGQEFMSGTLSKIRQARQMINDLQPACMLEVDGGINTQTAPRVVAAGADVLVAGEAIFAHEEGVGAAMRRMRESTWGVHS